MTTFASAIDTIEASGQAAKVASRKLARISSEVKNRALLALADGLLAHEAEILPANAADCADGKAAGLSDAMLDRLLLNHVRLEGMASDVRTVAALPDPVGEMFDMRTLPSGMVVGRKRVPLGVIGAIYESRPNVTVDISALCLKSGNAVVLRGGREAIRSNLALVRVIQQALVVAGVPEGAVQFIDNPDRELVGYFLKMKDTIDLMIPRGGADLIRRVAQEAAMPVVTGGVGVCHTYVDRSADLDMAIRVVHNAKVRRPTICNALDTVLVHRGVAEAFLPRLAAQWAQVGVELHADPDSLAILLRDAPEDRDAGRPSAIPQVSVLPATEDDWGKEFLALVAAIKVVDSLDEAIQHIEQYGSGHSEAIITEDYSAAMQFSDQVDAAAVYVNASTQFTDGGQFGLGAEVGISTQKFHARGPMGLREMTSYKWIILGNGNIRA